MAEVHHTESVPLSRLRPYPGNPRLGDVEAIKESLRRNGQYRPIVVNRRTMEVLAGNHTLRSAKDLGWEEIVASFIECTDEEAKRIVLVDNRTNDLAGYDHEALATLLEEIPSLEGSGYELADLENLLAELATEPDGPDLPRRRPRSRSPSPAISGSSAPIGCSAGTRVTRGPIAVSSPSEPAHLPLDRPALRRRLRGQDQAAPSNRGRRCRRPGRAAFGEPSPTSMARFAPAPPSMSPTPADRGRSSFGKAFLDAGWQLRQTLVWVKDTMVLGHSDYHYRHEPILYGYKPGDGRLGRGGAGWYGDDAQTSVFEVSARGPREEHPTMKPPELVEAALRNSSRAGETSCSIPSPARARPWSPASARGRHARLIELDPRYCDVIVERFETLTGETGGARADGPPDQAHPGGPAADRHRDPGRQLRRGLPLGSAGISRSHLLPLDGAGRNGRQAASTATSTRKSAGPTPTPRSRQSLGSERRWSMTQDSACSTSSAATRSVGADERAMK